MRLGFFREVDVVLVGFDSASRVNGEARKGDFSMFKTKSTPSKQNSLLPSRKGREMESQRVDGDNGPDESAHNTVPAGRYFAALRGPELDQVKLACCCEDIYIVNKITRTFSFPKMRNGLFSSDFQSVALVSVLVSVAKPSPMACTRSKPSYPVSPHHTIHQPCPLALSPRRPNFCFFHLHSQVHILLRSCQERVLPPCSCQLFLLLHGLCVCSSPLAYPPMLAPEKLHPALWCTFMGPYFFLELKIYGQWLSGGKRRLCKVANPSSHLSVVGNFVGALLASKVGWKEAAKFL
ncbi:hypothetical protein OIU78_009950 [Salix suchowensis]|nr:hypothetical protein OIU78_009950 [Salix suchowensis]